MKPQRCQPPTRVHVKVNSIFDPTGAVTPKTIIWADGWIFKIDTIRDFRPESTLGEGRTGDCYTVVIQGEEKQLFFERTNIMYGGLFGR